MVYKTEAIKNFLRNNTHQDLALLYNANMEVQVNVAQDGGERIQGEYKGKSWLGWTDGIQTWKSFRIPYNANVMPEYTDSNMSWDLDAHAEAIGMTGWDWKNKRSLWVAYDFDSLINHKSGLTQQELKEVKDALFEVSYTTIRKSTSGSGLHIYIYLDNFPTDTHTEHSALARAVLGNLAAITGIDLQTKVDVCGGNIWVWHRKMRGTDGLTLLKEGCVLTDIPVNWKDHLNVVHGKSTKVMPKFVEKKHSEFEELTGQRQLVGLDQEHLQLISWLSENNTRWWWDADHNMLVTHTIHLKDAFDQLKLRGLFETISTGKEKGNDHNCFMFPIKNGGWVVRRFTPGITEAPSWQQDAKGWTKCYYNRVPDIQTATTYYGAVEHPKKGFIFNDSESAAKALSTLGVNVELPAYTLHRKAVIKTNKDGRIIFELEAAPNIDKPEMFKGWLFEKDKWIRLLTHPTTPPENEASTQDDVVRHLITTDGSDCGWYIKNEEIWTREPYQNVKIALASLGYKPTEVTNIMGSSVFKCWLSVNQPFQPEYPGNRCWNRGAAQLRFVPSISEKLVHPTWDSVFEHLGYNLNSSVLDDTWCKENAIKTGAEYLKCWTASLFQQPYKPLPYLFFYGPENCGKSMFHEAISLLLTKGHVRADNALTNGGNFNGELQHAILCVVEETDLRKTRGQAAINRIKDWVTSPDLMIHAKSMTPFQTPNTTHWVQCNNDHQACPIFPGDTRIVMIQVDKLENLIPKYKFKTQLEKEAPDFLASILNLELPETNDRLNIPILDTQVKTQTQDNNIPIIEQFIAECCFETGGHCVSLKEFHFKFVQWLGPAGIHYTTRRVSSELPPKYPKARSKTDGQITIGNLAFEDKQPVGNFVVVNKFLELRHEHAEN